MTAAIDSPRYLPPVDVTKTYRLGRSLANGDEADFYFNALLSDGTQTIAAEPDGWEGAEYVTPIDTAGGRDGGLVGPQSMAPRSLAVQGLVVAPDLPSLRRRIQQIRVLLRPRTTCVWEQYDHAAGERMALVCRSEGTFVANPVSQRAAQVTFNLVAANPPWKYSVGQADRQCMALPSGVVTGRTYDKTYSWNYGSGTNPGGAMTVENRGGKESWPVFDVTGPVDSPIITNETTGQAFVIVQNIPAGQTVTIDARTGVVTPLNYRLVGRPWWLDPGINTIRWRATSGGTNIDAELCLTWRSTWE